MTSWLNILAVCIGIGTYAYIAYPLLLWLLAQVRQALPVMQGEPREWPRISITLPAYNAQETLRPVLDALVALDYPTDRRQILVVSDGSTDGTDALVGEYAARGIELLRIEGRLGKTEVENRAFASLTGDIIVNTDASVTVRPDAIKRLISAFQDPGVGAASARDISVSSVGAKGHTSEAAYVRYEMRIRDLETAVSGIIGSSGCLYAIRASLHRRPLPAHLSRDFASALWAHLHGLRAVSVHEAICFVPRAANMQIEYRRKIRTMSRGIQTLFYHHALLNPFRHGVFAWMLWSHKLVRWLVPFAVVIGVVAASSAAYLMPFAVPSLALFAHLTLLTIGAGLLSAATGWWWPRNGKAPKIAAMGAYFVSGTWAGIVAWKRAILGAGTPTWEPTPRALSAARGTPTPK